MKRFDVITIFPEMFEAVSRHGITRRALDEGLFDLKTWDPRDFTTDNYRRVDDRPYGGGPGMVMLPEPLQAAIDAARQRLIPFVPEYVKAVDREARRITVDWKADYDA